DGASDGLPSAGCGVAVDKPGGATAAAHATSRGDAQGAHGGELQRAQDGPTVLGAGERAPDRRRAVRADRCTVEAQLPRGCDGRGVARRDDDGDAGRTRGGPGDGGGPVPPVCGRVRGSPGAADDGVEVPGSAGADA